MNDSDGDSVFLVHNDISSEDIVIAGTVSVETAESVLTLADSGIVTFGFPNNCSAIPKRKFTQHK